MAHVSTVARFWAAVFSAILVFAADFHLPPGYAIWLLYFVPLLLASSSPARRAYVIAGLCAALLATGTFVPEGLSSAGRYYLNRFSAILALWILALFIVKKNRLIFLLRSSSEERERALAELDATLEAIPDGFIIYNRDSTIRRINGAARTMLGYTDESLRLPLDQRARNMQFAMADGMPLPQTQFPALRALRGETVRAFVMKVIFPDREAWFSAGAAPIRSRSGEISGAVTTFEDITEFYSLQSALKNATAIQEAFFEASPGIINILDDKLRYINTDGLTPRYFNLTREELKGKSLEELAPDYMELHGEMLRSVVERGESHLNSETNIPVPARPGEVAYWRVSFFPVPLGEGRRGLGITGIDITEMKRAEEQLRSERELLRTIIDTVPAMISIYDPKIQNIIFNKAFFTISGWTPEDLRKSNVMELVYPDPEYRKMATDYMQSLTPGFRDLRMITRTGESIETSWANIRIPDGRQVGIGIEITGRKRLEEQLAHRAEELAAANHELESFSYSISHDLRSPIRSIIGFSQILLEDHADRLGEEGKDFLRRIVTVANKMNSLVDDMLELSKVARHELRRETVSLTDIAWSVIDELRKDKPERKVRFNIGKGLTDRADARLMAIVMTNLLGNAWKYTKKEPDPSIEVGATTQDGQRIYFVRDNGAGFDMHQSEKLFVPFKRLHSEKEYSGTGVGLAIVERIIRRHGGKVWAEGEPGKGATFYFTLGRGRSPSMKFQNVRTRRHGAH